ncbi:MAG: 6,7-dimethyl-8-ribityllumazine synthase [Patescibacteria group bacterium]|nr:6,7-dimethyl-8-ribityllumazine synthase [Patescibacteria group bacterium]
MQRKNYEKKRAVKDASRLTVGVVVSRFNEDITEALLAGARETLAAWQVPEKNIAVLRVPGSYELPYGCLTLMKRKPDAVIALGCIIKGETEHDRYIANAAAAGIMQVSLAHRVPISFGVITTNNLRQAKARASGKTNKGAEAAEAALELVFLRA